MKLFLIAVRAIFFTLVLLQVMPSLDPVPIFAFFALLNLFATVPKNALMDGITLNDTTYAGEVLEGFLSLVATTFQTLEKGCINVLPGIKKKTTIPTIKIDSFIQASSEKPTHGGTVNVGSRVLEPKDFMGYLEFDPRIFEQHWLAAQMNPNLLDAELPQTAESAIIQEVFKYNKNWMDKAVWQSQYDAAAITTALTNGLAAGDNSFIFFNGLLPKMVADANVQKVANPVALTSGNIFEKLEAVKAICPEAVYEDERVTYMVSYKTAQIYADAQKAQTQKGVDKTSAGVMQFDGKRVVSLQGMPNDTIVLCKGSRDLMTNLWLGVNAVDEDEYLKLMPLQNNSSLWFLKMLMKVDVNYSFSEETALYTTETYA